MKKILLVLYGLFLALPLLFAGIEPSFTVQQTGTAFFANTALNHKVTTPTPFFVATGSATPWDNDFTLKSVTNLVKLYSDQNSTTPIGFDYDLQVPIKITYYQNGFLTPIYLYQTLFINYHPNPSVQREYRQMDAFRFSNGCEVKVEIEPGLTATRLDGTALSVQEKSDLAKTIVFESEIQVERYFKFIPSYQHLGNNFLAPSVNASKELKIQWNPISGAEEYDLEWIFVDNYDGTDYPTPGAIPAGNLPFDFNLNAARVQIKTTSYSIPLVYERGYLLFRVRGIGRSAVDNFVAPVPGLWSCGFTPCPTSGNSSKGMVGNYHANCRYQITIPYENDKMNWQSVTTYAEEGKRKDVVQHFDGAMYNRQSVTVLSTERMALVGETIYDHQGRPAVQVLPVPVNDATIKYYPSFNQNTAGKPYNRLNFDTTKANCVGIPEPMLPNNSGAANYYSTFNPIKTGMNAYIPDAEGYPFTQTEYMPDNTGRIRRQSGVGNAHLLGGGHETKYFYGSPVQPEIDRLFGNECGEDLHYKKNMVIDANGQISVTIMDPKGNTIATALAGNPPVALDALDSYQKAVFDVDLLGANVVDSINYSLTTTRTLLVNTDSKYDFVYTMTGLQYRDLTCMKGSVCYDCIYDLELLVLDNLNCNNIIYQYSTTIGQLVTFVSSGSQQIKEGIINKCESTPYSFDSKINLPVSKPFDPILKVGSYTVIKKLKVNVAAADAYVADFLTDKTNICSQKKEDFIKAEMSKIDTFGCNIDCDEFDADAVAGTLTPAMTPAEIAEFKEGICDSTMSLCETAYAGMLADVSPGGQYGFIPGAPPQNQEDPLLSVFLANPVLPAGIGSAIPYYQNSSLNFLDINGNTAMVDLGNGPVKVNHQSVPLNVFVNNWRAEWAVQLLPYHPEYQYYQFCEQYLDQSMLVTSVGKTYSSEDYDTEMAETHTLADAISKGFISLGTGPNDPYSIRNNDPFFASTIFPNTNLWMDLSWSNTMKNKIDNFGTVSNPISMKAMAIAIANCPNDPTTCNINNWYLNGNGDQAWENYRVMYATIKQQILYRIRSKFAIAQKGYNECIGQVPFNHKRNQFNTGFFNQTSNQFFNNFQYCNIWNHLYFSHKVKRFPSVYDILPKGFPYDFETDDPVTIMNYIHDQNKANGVKACCSVEQNFPKFILALLKQGSTFIVLNANDPTYPADILDLMLQGATSTSVGIVIVGNKYTLNFKTGCVVSFSLSPSAGAKLSDMCCLNIGSTGMGPFNMTVSYSNGTSQSIVGNIERCPIKCPEPVTECPPTQEAEELNGLFNYLFFQNKLVATHPVPANFFGAYLTGNLGSNKGITWQATQTGSTINAKIIGDSISECSVTLKLPSNVNPADLVMCMGVRPDLSQPITTTPIYGFILKVKLVNGTLVDVYGSSTCFPISFCCNWANNRTLGLGTGKPLPGITVPDDVFRNCHNCRPLTITGGIFGSPTWSAACPLVCDSIKEYSKPLPNPCVQQLLDVANFNASQLYAYYLDSLKAAVRDAYMKHCLKAVETFTVKYYDAQHHFTLYYYDQANNLVKTVPPAGVDTLNATERAQAAAHRQSGIGSPIYPSHILVSNYRYNSLNQLIWQKIPDHTLADYFFYDALGRLVASVNAKQQPSGLSNSRIFSYTKYDPLGRIIEVGQSSRTVSVSSPYASFLSSLKTNAFDYKNWNTYINAGLRTEITRTDYDQSTPAIAALFPNAKQVNLRGRVAAITWLPKMNALPNEMSQFWYSYDIHGNVHTLVQHSFDLDNKTVEYKYDLVSGKVNSLSYQRGKADQFHHAYTYDADNRLTQVRTSPDSVLWDMEAKYAYYKHGPLARVELGNDRVQGLDYAYTLHGWIKGMNSGSLNPKYDMGGDGQTATVGNFARDAVGYLLSYYDNEYKPIGGNNVKFEPAYTGTSLDAAALAPSLYNGNIRHMVTAIEPFMAGQIPLATMYKYDQLNRLKKVNCDQINFDPAGNKWLASNTTDPRWTNSFTYDANGNILTQKRNGDLQSSTAVIKDLAMDDMQYKYYPATNKLQIVSDAIDAKNYAGDIDNQAVNSAGQIVPVNYIYDGNGNLIKDNAEKLVLQWNLQGKVSKIIDSDTPTKIITFGYNPMGNRAVKTVDGESTYHAYDASGNVLATYRRNSTGQDTLESAWIFGSSRLGEFRANKCVVGCARPPIYPDHFYRIRGKRRYEESNHLGNVLATVSDRKVQVVTSNVVTSFAADVVSAGDYYAFGMEMAGRTMAGAAGRYGFNGKEVDDEVKGSGNSLDFGARTFDSRLGRFLTLDNYYSKFPSNSPYQFAGNYPLSATDNNGDSTVVIISGSPSGTYTHNGVTYQTYALDVFENMTLAQYDVHVSAGTLPDPDYTMQIARDAHDTSSKGSGIAHSNDRYGTANETPPGNYYLFQKGTNGDASTGAYDLYIGDTNGSRLINGPDGERAGVAIHQYSPSDSQGCFTTCSGTDITPVTNLINAIPDLTDDTQPVFLRVEERFVKQTNTFQQPASGTKYTGSSMVKWGRGTFISNKASIKIIE